jgi:hypothetical protein
VILFLFFSINSQNHDGESLHKSGEAIFSALDLLVHFRESLHKIRRESLLSEKLFGKAPAEFTRELAPGALPNRA